MEEAAAVDLDVKQRGRERVLDKQRGKKKTTRYYCCTCPRCDMGASLCSTRRAQKIHFEHDLRVLLRSNPKEIAMSNLFV